MLKDKDLTQSYEDLSYPNDAYALCDPASLIANASLHLSRLGLEAIPQLQIDHISGLRILEIGCARGGNLIPLAAKYPKMHCVGVDLSASQIRQAEQDAKALQLNNIELYAASVLDLDLRANSFDIIIAHGVLSWVDRATAQAILMHSSKLLKDSGLLYVSYNTLPGWYQEKAIRDMMEFHARETSSPHDEISKAREILSIGVALASDTSYREHLHCENLVLQNVPDGYLYHDYLETFNEPYYLKDVAHMAMQGGLNYLGDCDLSGYRLSPEAESFIQQQDDKNSGLASHIIQEQYQDFLTNRRFRQSIFIKSELKAVRTKQAGLPAHLTILLNAHPQEPHTYYELSKAQSLTLVSERNVDKSAVEEVNDEVEVRLMSYLLCKKLAPVSLDVLHAELALECDVLEAALWSLMYKGLIHVRALSSSLEGNPHPCVWSAGRYYASMAASSVNLYHKNIHLDTASRRLISLCDGTRAVPELVGIILSDINQAQTNTDFVEDNYPYLLLGEKIISYRPQDRKELVQFFVDDALIQFSKLGLLLE